MKFLCDRCKTRYSIGDDRVRGKILKIRCKNCANVITVREGMTADDDDRRSRPTTAAPMSTVGQPATDDGALASAFAQQLAKPPPALEEEWYVSIDGVQSGPFGLAAAQRWISTKAFDADLHCWSEGFDDWLPVDKVSHFRGLRKKPRPSTAPPPTPRPRPVEDEPKPLFAATMASLERASTTPDAMAIPAAHATPTNGAAAKANGTGPAIAPRGPVAAKTMVGMGAKPNGAVVSAGQSALAAAFDVPAESEPAAAAVQPAPFDDLAPRAADPFPPPAHDDAEDNLEIGEVSRVVNLADLMKSANQQRPKPRAPGLRGTGSTPKLDPAALGLAAATSPGGLDSAPEAEGFTAAPVVAQAHRRCLIMLIGVAGVLLVGVTVLLVLMLNKDDGDVAQGGLGPAHEIDTSRPEEIVRAHMTLPPPSDGSAGSAARPIRHFQPLPPHGGGPTPDTPDVPSNRLKADEIEDMAQKQAAGTQRCYMRAQRGAEGVMLGDLKKISVTLVVDKTGVVTDVQLSDHATDSLGTCLAGQIKRWKFRESAGGQFRIVLAFADN